MKKIRLFQIVLVSIFSVQAHAGFVVTNNFSSLSVDGSVEESVNGPSDVYSNSTDYTQTLLPLAFAKSFTDSVFVDLPFTEASSSAELNYEIFQALDGSIQLTGDVSSSADSIVGSPSNSGATASGKATADLAFTLTTDYRYIFDIDFAVFSQPENGLPSGLNLAEAKLVNNTTGNTVFDQLEKDDLSLVSNGNLSAGDYSLYLGTTSEALENENNNANLDITLQLTAVPLPASLQLLLSGIALLGLFRVRS